MLVNYKDYRIYLKNTFENRCKANSRYSLRAFARDLEISPSKLCEIFAEKRGMSLDTAQRVAFNLSLSKKEINYFCDLVAAQHARSNKDRELASERIQKSKLSYNYKNLTTDQFNLVANWYHYAILELLSIAGFRSDARWISKRLGITESQAKEALLRLRKLRLLKQEGNLYKRADKNITTTYDVPSLAIRELNKQLILKGIDALERQNVNERDFSTITMAIDKRKLSEAKERIKEFRRELAAFLEDGAQKNVYSLCIQLFRIDEPIKEDI